LRTGDLMALLTLKGQEEPWNLRVKLERFHCGTCDQATFLTVKEVTTVVPSEGKVEEKEKTLLLHAVTTPQFNEQFIRVFTAPEPPAAPAPALSGG
jgi:hypothetical protein